MLGVVVWLLANVTSSQRRHLRTLLAFFPGVGREDVDGGLEQSAVWDSVTFASSLAKERCPVPPTALKVPAIRKTTLGREASAHSCVRQLNPAGCPNGR
jgi:hypothetical protein